jgi:DNA mismatch endonuclease (patch repair protein)
MSRISGKNTSPEMLVRRHLHSKGLRYRVTPKLPGKPDLAFPKKKIAIFIHGCFWHGHQPDCPVFRLPKSNTPFWRDKIDGNRLRDLKKQGELECMGWTVLTTWECALERDTGRELDRLFDAVTR